MTQLRWTLLENGRWRGYSPQGSPEAFYEVWPQVLIVPGLWAAGRFDSNAVDAVVSDVSLNWSSAFDAKMRCQSDYDLRVIASEKPRRKMFRRRK